MSKLEQVQQPGGATEFENLRGRLLRLAYRMTGSAADAEDIVQETWLRWRSAGQPQPNNPPAYFSMIATRLCLDRLKQASRRREQYVGVWLPEPVVAEWSLADHDDNGLEPLDISYAMMMVLERLSPLERAAFLLHDLFDASFEEISATLERSPAACRKLASRARRNVRDGPKRYQPDESDLLRLGNAFVQSMSSGDTAPLKALFAEDIVFFADGGGKVLASINPVYGAENVARLFLGLAGKQGITSFSGYVIAPVNGAPAFVFRTPDGGVQSFGFDLDEAQRITAVYIVRNPDKVTALDAVAPPA